MQPARIDLHTDHLNTRDGLHLAERSWLPDGKPRASIALVHGFGDHTGRYERVADFFNDRGYAFHGYDQRGHGRSEGRRTFVRVFDDYIDDLDLFLLRLRRTDPDLPLFLFGHSMGGLVAAQYAIDRGTAIEGVILSSPMFAAGDSVPTILQDTSILVGRLFPTLPTIRLKLSDLSHREGVVHGTQADPLYVHHRIPARTGAEMVRAGRYVLGHAFRMTQPLLLVHGTDDRITSPAASRHFYGRVGSTDKTLRLYEGMYHETFNEPDGATVLADIASWLDARTLDAATPTRTRRGR